MKIVISNRVFWAGVVLASAALMGRNGGRAQGQAPSGEPVVPAEIKTHKLIVVDDAGQDAITLEVAKGIVGIRVGAAPRTGAVSLFASPKSGPIIFLQGKDKSIRTIGLDPSRDLSEKGAAPAN